MLRLGAFLAVIGVALIGCSDAPALDESATVDSADAAETTAVASGDAPDWYVERADLEDCGEDEDYGDAIRNREARSCFREAYDSDVPTEVTRISFGDEGESIRAHFRILGGGDYEIVGQQFASPVGEEFGGDGWVRYLCDRFVFIEDPGGEVDGVPIINAEGECELIEQVEG